MSRCLSGCTLRHECIDRGRDVLRYQYVRTLIDEHLRILIVREEQELQQRCRHRSLARDDELTEVAGVVRLRSCLLPRSGAP